MATIDPRQLLNFRDNTQLMLPDTAEFTALRQKAPTWTVEIAGGLTKSKVEGSEASSQLFDFHYNYSRNISGHTGGEFFTDSGIEHSPVYIAILAGTYSPLIRNALNDGTKIETIIIKRLGNITDLKQSLQILTYTTCYLAEVVQKNDFLGVSFRFSKVKEENKELDQDATVKGQNVSEIDYSLLTKQ